MLHGHAKIELTNVKTGEKKVIEHDNMLTGWLRDMFTPKGVEAHSLAGANYNYNNNYNAQTYNKSKLFGGVLLFEDTLSNDANDYCFPVENKMTAHGDDAAYSGSDLTKGSFNASLSSESDTEKVAVWDWTQERGNGTISALGLCNRWAGAVGAGQSTPDENQYYIDLFNMLINQGLQSGDNEYKVQNAVWFSYEDSILYILRSMAAGVLTIVKKHIPFSKYDAIMQTVYPTGATGTSVFHTTKEDTITVDISSYITGNTLPAFTVKDGILYLLATGNWSSGSKTLVKYNLSDGTVTTESVTNNTGKTLYVNNIVGSWGIYRNELYFQTSDGLFVYINLQDNTDCGVVKDRAGTNITYSGSAGGIRFVRAFGTLMFSYSTLGTGTNTIWTVAEKGKATKNGCTGITKAVSATSNLNTIVALIDTDFKGTTWIAYDDFSGNRAIVSMFNWLALSTKQNLDSAVTKTSDMTMRLTYTIREAT